MPLQPDRADCSATPAARGRTLLRIPLVQRRGSGPLAPTRGVQTTIVTEAPSSRPISKDRATSHPTTAARATPPSRISSGKEDPVVASRDSKVSTVKEKFSDVFNVSKSCDLVDRRTLDQFSDDISVAGRLSQKSSIDFFEKIGASNFLLNILKKGHYPQLASEVPEMERKNNGSFYKHHDFAVAEVKKLIASDRVEIVTTRPHCVLPLHVVVQPKKNRLILDCTALNEFIIVPKIKFDDYKCALNSFHSKGYLICFDFKDGYFHICVCHITVLHITKVLFIELQQ